LRQVGACVSELREILDQALEECGQLPECGGLNPVDVEEIEALAVLYRGQQMARPSRREGYVAYRETKNQMKVMAGDGMTPPKKYTLGGLHSVRHFHGELVHFMNLGTSKRKRLIYRREPLSDQVHHPLPLPPPQERFQYSTNPLVDVSSKSSCNQRHCEMIVEKFALCRYLSLIEISPCSSTRNEIELFLYDDEREAEGCLGEGKKGERRLKDMLVTNRGPGSWIHATLNQPDRQRKWLASYCEGTIWLSIFTLCYWDIIFDSTVPFGMMRAHFNRPIDLLPERHLHHPSISSSSSSSIQCYAFYSRRRNKIHLHLNFLRKLSRVELLGHFQEVIERATSRSCFGINWERFDSYLVLSVICSLGGERLCHIMSEMVKDPVSYSRGMPDLLFCLDYHSSLHLEEVGKIKEEDDKIKMSTKKRSRPVASNDGDSVTVSPWETESIFVSEVKSTHDELSLWQKLWIKLLSSAKVHFEECRVN
jgi:hypothetical protein